MTPYDRYMGTVKDEPVDCAPRIPILMHFAARYGGMSYGDFARDHDNLVRANLKIVHDFDCEIVDVMSDPYREMVDFGGRIEYLPEAVPRCVEAPLAIDKDLDRLTTPDMAEGTRMRNAIHAIAAYKNALYRQYAITGWVEGPAAEAGVLRQHGNFLVDLLTDEDYACELMDRCVEVAMAFARAQIEAGADTIGVGDAIASQMSQDWWSAW